MKITLTSDQISQRSDRPGWRVTKGLVFDPPGAVLEEAPMELTLLDKES